MPLTMYVDEERWHKQQSKVLSSYPDLVPVAKGNGYGFGLGVLAAQATRLGSDTLAVGTAAEAWQVADDFGGRLLVLVPEPPGREPEPLPERAIRLVGSVTDAVAATRSTGRPVVVDCLTSLRRHGVDPAALPELRAALPDELIDGFAVHMPMDRAAGSDPVAELDELLRRIAAAGLPTGTMYVSHLTPAEVGALGDRHQDTKFRARIGTELWLGDGGALSQRATVLDVHPVRRGDRYGYRQRRSRRAGHLVVVAGGTAHGVGLDAPKHVRGLTARGKVLARAGLAAVNRNLSPYSWQGRQCWFAEPPHMQISVLMLPAGVTPPAPGQELPVTLRHTTTHFDRVELT
jgi:hypothetical protein